MADLSLGSIFTTSPSSVKRIQRTDMNEEQRRECILKMLHKAEGLKLPRSVQKELADNYSVSKWTIWRLWKSVQNFLSHKAQLKATKNYKGNVGRKALQVPEETIISIPLKKRCNIRSMAAALNVSKSIVHKLVKLKKIKRHSNSIKPSLTVKNKIERLRWCLQQIIPPNANTPARFNDMYNVIHVDEKWFNMSKESQKFYLTPSEAQPYRHCKSKRHICKIMFLVAVARPIFGVDGTEIFDGKIAVIPLTRTVPAQRNNIHRQAGTLETKPIKNITKEVIKEKFINELIPAIKAKWPLQSSGTIFIQQDNARPHIDMNDPDFERAANTDGFNIHLISQPPNSPDLNVLDLGFFRAIQAIQYQQMPATIDQLVSAVKYAYYDFDPKLLNFVFLTYQYVMRKIMTLGGGNNYQLPHASKERMEREGALPISIEVSTDIIQQAISSLVQQYVSMTDQNEEQIHVEEQIQESGGEAPMYSGYQYLSNQEVEAMHFGDMETEVGDMNIN